MVPGTIKIFFKEVYACQTMFEELGIRSILAKLILAVSPNKINAYMGCNRRGCECPHIQTIESPFHQIRSPHSSRDEVGVLFSLDQANTSTIVQTHQ